MATPKVLRGTTIVPEHLYVERAADRQLRAIVEDMGRPGYVLVARQMGKTNMLLRMKRQQEAHGAIAIFIDLSTGFPSSVDLFRRIVDELLDAIGDSEAAASIEDERRLQKYAPGIEFDRHLRRCLDIAEGRSVIIILDEIDSLVGLDYSDRVLAQIRSMYFARANHPIYNNLTYVLSGVAEPTDLIKDKNISPFNIGEKIYLDDFTLAEQNLLIRKAGLSFGLNVEERIYEWAQGNPRMTWDICSSVEDLQRSGMAVLPNDVEDIVKRLYFERFDRPPIDHIRDLAESDHSLRSAIIALLYGRGASLSDRDKSRLYLSGVTTASANRAPTIKNRIIEEALSERWLAQVTEGAAGLLRAAGDQAKDKNFGEALRLYDRFLAEGGVEADIDEVDLYQYGIVLHNMGRPEDATRVLLAAIAKTRSPEVRSSMRYHLGLSYLRAGSLDDAEREFRTVSEKVDSPFSLRALHALSSVMLSRDEDLANSEALALATKVLEQIDVAEDLTDDEKQEVKSASHFNIARALSKSADGIALQHYRDAYLTAVPDEKPFYAANLLLAEEYSSFEKEVASEIAKSLNDNNLPYGQSQSNVEFKKRHLGIILGAAALIGDCGIIENVLGAIYKRSADSKFEAVFDVISSVAMNEAQARVAQASLRLLTERTDLRADAAVHRLMEAARIRDAVVDLSGTDDDREDAFHNFFATVKCGIEHDAILAADLLRLSNRIQQEISRGRLGPARDIIEFIKTHRKRFENIDKYVLALCIYHEMAVHRLSAEVSDARIAAQEVIELLGRRSDLDISDYLSKKAQETIRQSAEKFLSAGVKQSPRFRPNDLVAVIHTGTGLRTKMKYKKALPGIKDGLLKLVPGQ